MAFPPEGKFNNKRFISSRQLLFPSISYSSFVGKMKRYSINKFMIQLSIYIGLSGEIRLVQA